jgi:hypothetical protein
VMGAARRKSPHKAPQNIFFTSFPLLGNPCRCFSLGLIFRAYKIQLSFNTNPMLCWALVRTIDAIPVLRREVMIRDSMEVYLTRFENIGSISNRWHFLCIFAKR